MSAPNKDQNPVLIAALIGAAAMIIAALISGTLRIYAAGKSNGSPANIVANKQPAPTPGTSPVQSSGPSPIESRNPSTPISSGPLPFQPPRREPPATKINPKDGAEMILIPAGAFPMGSKDSDSHYEDEKPQRSVDMDGYYIYKYPVTVTQYRKFCEDTGRTMPAAPRWGWNANYPMVNVSWEDADAYCKWASGNNPGSVRLPTEAQWEKAARGTDGRIYPWGNDWNVNNLQCSVGKSAGGTAPIDSFEAGQSPYHVWHMAGNVWQWCADWYDKDYYKTAPEKNPTGPSSGSDRRVLRGGSWNNFSPVIFRAADRTWNSPTAMNNSLGFRCASGL